MFCRLTPFARKVRSHSSRTHTSTLPYAHLTKCLSSVVENIERQLRVPMPFGYSPGAIDVSCNVAILRRVGMSGWNASGVADMARSTKLGVPHVVHSMPSCPTEVHHENLLQTLMEVRLCNHFHLAFPPNQIRLP